MDNNGTQLNSDKETSVGRKKKEKNSIPCDPDVGGGLYLPAAVPIPALPEQATAAPEENSDKRQVILNRKEKYYIRFEKCRYSAEWRSGCAYICFIMQIKTVR